jgi:hypothetical protein
MKWLLVWIFAGNYADATNLPTDLRFDTREQCEAAVAVVEELSKAGAYVDATCLQVPSNIDIR